MCSRFEPAVKEDVILRWDINPGSNVLGSAKWTTIYPKYDTLLITYENEPIVRSWGLTPEWAKRPLINAKSEEAHEKRTFTPLLGNRCIIPAASYYEWQGPKGSKIKTNIFGKSMLPIAGLCNEEQYVMFTCAPAEAISHIHNRMPVILEEDAVSEWLKPENDYSDLRMLLQPYGGQLEWNEAA